MSAGAAGGLPLAAVPVEALPGEPSEEVREGFGHMFRSAPAEHADEVAADEVQLAYELRRDGDVFRIWLAPSTAGLVCFLVEAGRIGGLAGGCSPARPRVAIEVGSMTGSDPSQGLLWGRAVVGIDRLQLVYANGDAEPVEIQNGYFVATVEPVRMLRGSDHPVELVGLDGNGVTVARQPVSSSFEDDMASPERPPIALIDQEQAVDAHPLEGGGEALLLVSPARGGGSCGRLVVDDETWQWVCNRELGASLRYSLHKLPAGAGVAIALLGAARPGLTVELRFEDGTVERPALTDGIFLAVLGRERAEEGARLETVAAVDTSGADAVAIPMATGDSPLYAGGPDREPQPPITGDVQPPPGLPSVAVVELETTDGRRVTLEVLRETAEQWYEVLHVDNAVRSSEALTWIKAEKDALLGAGWYPLLSEDGKSDVSLLIGHLRPPAASARVVYDDGSTEEIPVIRPSELVGGGEGISGFFLLEITDGRRDRHPVRLEGLDKAGNVVASQPIPDEV